MPRKQRAKHRKLRRRCAPGWHRYLARSGYNVEQNEEDVEERARRCGPPKTAQAALLQQLLVEVLFPPWHPHLHPLVEAVDEPATTATLEPVTCNGRNQHLSGGQRSACERCATSRARSPSVITHGKRAGEFRPHLNDIPWPKPTQTAREAAGLGRSSCLHHHHAAWRLCLPQPRLRRPQPRVAAVHDDLESYLGHER